MKGYIGEIKLFAGSFVPENWALCDGRTLSVSKYQALFSVIYTTYGGDGASTFALPTLSPLAGASYLICMNGDYPARG